MSLARVLGTALMLAAVVPGPSPARAEDVIPPKVVIRRFPQGQFCALPVTMTFTAPADPIIITFTAVQWVDDGSGTLTWTDQAIDNVTIAPTNLVTAHTAGPPDQSSPSWNCYNRPNFDDPPVSYFHFNGLTIDLLELFDNDPTARGWNLSNGGVYLPNRSAPRDVDADGDIAFGSLGIGNGSGAPDASQTKSVSLVVSGLTQGNSYDLGAWWDANFVRFPHDTDYLTISITTDHALPVARKSWGRLKASYR